MAGFELSILQLRKLVEGREHAEEFNAMLGGWGGAAGVCEKLKSDPRGGIKDVNSLQERRDFYGANEMPQKKPATYLQLAWEALQDATLIMLVIAAVVSLSLGMAFEEDKSTAWIEGVAILVAVVVVVNVTAGNDWLKERQFLALNATMEDEDIDTVRAGKPTVVSVKELVVGDIVELKVGDNLSADGLLTMGADLKCDEHSQTGESDLIKKDAAHPILLSGTKVMEGTGRMLVLAVGKNSQSGIIKDLVINGAAPVAAPSKDGEGLEGGAGAPAPVDEGGEEELTGRSVLGAKLDKLALQIGYAGGIVALVCMVVMFIRFFVELDEFKSESWAEMLSFVITAITILVVAIPEGLPLAVTISLAFSGHRMLSDNNLVKHLDACETMGSATTICSDKTGTLTTSRMTVVKALVGGQMCNPAPAGEVASAKKILALIAECIALDSQPTSRVETEGRAIPEYFGNATECGLIVWMTDTLGHTLNSIRKQERFRFEEPLKAFPFSSARKRMSFLHPLSGYSSGEGESKGESGAAAVRVFTKGASERVLGLCNRIAVPDSEVRGDEVVGEVGEFKIIVLTEERRKTIEGQIADMAEDGLRTLGLAYRDLTNAELPTDPEAYDADEIETKLTMLCVVGIEDPVRPEVPGAIARCRKAGISVMMVTGDHISTARAIARKCGILLEGDDTYKAMTGPEFREKVLIDPDGDAIDQAEFDKIWPTLRVLARSSPKDKFTLVRGLQNSSLYRAYRKDPKSFRVPIYPDRQVIAVTGDGTNDAPALSKADVGFAMGIQGTNVARTACDIVLLDDNFKSIVAACKWGRNVYDSVAKFLQFQLTVNISAIVIASVGALALNHSPLTAVQMLWVNLIMDSFASLALATEPPTEALLDRKPYGRNRSPISRQMWFNMFGQSTYQLIICLWIIFMSDAGRADFGIFDDGTHHKHGDPPTVHYTFLFNTFVLMQLFNELNARKIYGEWWVFEGIHTNALFIAIMVGTALVQVLVVQYGGRAFSCVALTSDQWLWCLLFGVISLPFQYVINAVVRSLPDDFLTPAEYGKEPETGPGVGPADVSVVVTPSRDGRSARGASAGSGGIHLKARRNSSFDMLERRTSAGAAAEEAELEAAALAMQQAVAGSGGSTA